MLDTYINEIKANKLNAKWELACYTTKTNEAPDRIFEYDFKDYGTYCEALEMLIRDYDYEKIEIAILGQDKDGYNEIVYCVKTLIVRS